MREEQVYSLNDSSQREWNQALWRMVSKIIDGLARKKKTTGETYKESLESVSRILGPIFEGTVTILLLGVIEL